MKKAISIIIIFVFTLCNYTAFADGGEIYQTVEPVEYAETCVDQSINLFGNERTLEQTLVEGWSSLQGIIDVAAYNISANDIDDIYRSAVYNNPQLYYVSNGFGYSYNPLTQVVSYVAPIYTETDVDVITATMDDISAATEEILMYVDESMTDFEKVMTVHDYMVLHYEYDNTLSNHSITIMTTKTGVCMSYAFAFKHLMNKLGIECLYVASSEEMNHGWNLVKLDGSWYHIDLTWDDLGEEYGQISHKYALLSDHEIQNLENPHHGYDLKSLSADSDKYDKEHWHEGHGSVVTINKIYYYVDGNNLVDQSGKIIYSNLDGGDGSWSIGGWYYFPNDNYTGVAEHNGILYFNTDKAIYSYNPNTEKLSRLLSYDGICGMTIDRNTLEYYKLDMETNRFTSAGKYNLGKIRFGGTFHEGGKITKRIYKEDDADKICVYAHCTDCVKSQEIQKSGISTISFDAKDCQTLFYWDSNLKPLIPKEVYK